VNDKLEVHVALQNKRNSMISSLHKPRGYGQGLLVEAEWYVGVNKLPFGVNKGTRGRQAIGCPKDLDLMSWRRGSTLT
jgi:hypothetical protein